MRKGLWLVALAVVLAACGDGEGDSAVKRAEAQVTSKEKALSEALSEAAEAAEAFCGDSKSYIVALDRYGDVLSSTAPTVGDVNEAGADLAEPSDDATKAAESAVEAQEKVAEAERELAEARTALAEIQPSSGRPHSPSATESESPTSPPPMPPTETVDRVKQAEAQFESAQAGIADQTPLVQASQQFNAAAVALEMSWLRLYNDAGCLTKEQQKQAEAAVSEYTRTLQESLSEAGYYQGEVDGVYGPETVDAVEALQESHGLPVTGTLDKATAAALESDLQAMGGVAAEAATASTAAVQQTLKLAGFWDGPIDGDWTPELTDALKSFQTELGVDPTGTVDAATVAAFEHALEDAQPPEQTPPADSESTTGTDTPSPSST